MAEFIHHLCRSRRPWNDHRHIQHSSCVTCSGKPVFFTPAKKMITAFHPPFSPPSNLFKIFFPSFSLFFSAASTSAPLPHLPHPPPQAPGPLPALVFSLYLHSSTSTHTVRTNTHALLMPHDQSQPPLRKKNKKYSNALFGM